jgi:hypothetical protein
MIRIKRFTNFSLLLNLFFPIIIFIIYFFSLIALPVFISWLAGWLIVFIGFVFELLLTQRGLTRNDKSFIRNVLGAVMVRLFLTLLLVFISLRFLELNQNNFIFSTFFFYIFYLIIEIFYLNFRNS